MVLYCTDCGGNITLSNVTKDVLVLSSPGFPKGPQKNLTCVWIIETPAHTDNTTVNVINYKYEIKDYKQSPRLVRKCDT